MRKKNIVILTASHPYKAAGVVAFDLMQVLMQADYNVTIITNSRLEKVYENTLSLKGISFLTFPIRVCNSIRIRVNNLFKKNRLKSNPDYHMNGIFPKRERKLSKAILKMLSQKVDGFIYLFPQNFLDTADLNYLSLKTNSPVFWYMMDMAPMTGGCHYAWDCDGYTKKCGKCPGIFSNDISDLTNQLWIEKMKYIKSSNIIPIAASEWQFNQLKISSLFSRKDIYKILIPIDSNIFKPENKIEARTKLNLEKGVKIIFFGATRVNDKKKGFNELIDALTILRDNMDNEEFSNVLLIIAGNRNKQIQNIIPFNHKFLGYLNYTELAVAYQAADIFVCPSIEDSGPMMINQSMMCGTPVVAFEMGVALDLVVNNFTGLRVENKNSLELSNAIKTLITLPSSLLEDMSSNCRKLALEKTSKEVVCKQWLKILQSDIYKL